MKRVLVFALVLFFAGASVFAVDLGNGLTAAGEIKTGVRVLTENDDTTVDLYHTDAGGTGFRPRLTLTYTGDWGGAMVRFQNTQATSGVDLPVAYGWANLLGGKIVVAGGALADSWGLPKLSSYVFDPNLDGVTGARVEFKPIDGLSLGVAVPLTQSKKVIDNVIGDLVFGGLYKSDLFSVVGAVALEPKREAKTGTPEVLLYTSSDGTNYVSAGKISKVEDTSARDAYVDAIVGIEVPVSPLNIIVDARINTLSSDTGETGFIRIAPLFRFSSGPLGAHARADILVPNGKGTLPSTAGGGKVEKSGDTGIAFRVGGDYAVTDAIKPYLRVGSDNVSYLDGNGLYVQPGFTFTVGGANIEIFDKINKIAADNNVVKISNQFQIDFKWSF
jgi:hypothetical protein